MKITKNYTKTYDCYEAVEWVETFGETMETRNKFYDKNHDKFLEKCFMCGYKFKDSDIPWLGLVMFHKNVFLCEECGKAVRNEQQNER